jgi:hypothetical protein
MDILGAILVSGVLQLGIIPGHTMAMYGTVDNMVALDVQRTYFVDYQARAEVFKYGFLTGGFTSYSMPFLRGANFYPFRVDYTLGAGLRTKNLELGWAHGCFHPIAPNLAVYPLPKVDSGYDQFYVKVFMGKSNWKD